MHLTKSMGIRNISRDDLTTAKYLYLYFSVVVLLFALNIIITASVRTAEAAAL